MLTIEHANNNQNFQHHLKFSYDLRDRPGHNYQHFLAKRNKKKRHIHQHPILPEPLNQIPKHLPIENIKMADNFITLLLAFHGKATENLRDYVSHFKIYAQLEDIHGNLENIHIHFGQFLRDCAFKWWQNHHADEVADAQALYNLFITAFLREEPYFSKMSRLRERKYTVNDTPQTYTDGILILCHKLYLNEAAQIQYFIGGLPESLQSIISAINPQTFAVAFNTLFSMRKYLDEHVKRDPTQSIQSDQKLALLGFQLERLTSELQSLRLIQDQAVNATFTARY